MHPEFLGFRFSVDWFWVLLPDGWTMYLADILLAQISPNTRRTVEQVLQHKTLGFEVLYPRIGFWNQQKTIFYKGKTLKWAFRV